MKDTRPTRANFTLLKCKKIGGGSIAYEYKIEQQEGGISHEKVHSVKSTHVAHPDLMRIFSDLTEIYIKAQGRDILHNLGQMDLGKAVDNAMEKATVRKLFKALSDEAYDSMESTAVSMQSKEGEIQSAVISGVRTFQDGKAIGSPTTKIELHGTSHFGIEAQLLEACENMKEEVFCFEFEGKHNQLEIGFDEEVQLSAVS